MGHQRPEASIGSYQIWREMAGATGLEPVACGFGVLSATPASFNYASDTKGLFGKNQSYLEKNLVFQKHDNYYRSNSITYLYISLLFDALQSAGKRRLLLRICFGLQGHVENLLNGVSYHVRDHAPKTH